MIRLWQNKEMILIVPIGPLPAKCFEFLNDVWRLLNGREDRGDIKLGGEFLEIGLSEFSAVMGLGNGLGC